jgi:nickel-dependent lactate racemase
MALIKVPYGERGLLELEVEDRHLVLDTDTDFPSQPRDLAGAVLTALESPVAGPPFSERLKRAKRVLILIDNWARLTPAGKLLPPILETIERAGKKAEILVASGLLREMTEAELRAKLGPEVLASGIEINQTKARETWDYRFVGVTSYGTPVSLHRKLLEADLSLAVTMTQATLWGYGGGGSMVLPGAASVETIEWNHRLMTGPKSSVGYEPPRNRMREDIEEACLISGLDLSLLAVLNPGLKVIHLTAGETIAAHRASVAKYDRHYTYDLGRLPGRLDVAVSGSFPGDRFFAHACWPVANLDHFVRDGGTIILCTPVPGGLAHYSYAKDYMPPTPEAIRRLYEDVFYGKQALWHACLWMPIIETMGRKEVLVVTEEERVADFGQVGIKALTSLKEAYDLVRRKHGPDLKLGHFPHGKWVLPAGLNRDLEDP